MTRPPHSNPQGRPGRSGLLGRTALAGAVGASLLGAAIPAWGGPTGASSPSTVAKPATVTTAGSTTTVQLNQSKTIIDWSSFNISKGESVDFLFGSNSGIVLNRVNGMASIDGALKGCVVTCQVIGGNVWIYASNGVIFGHNARVDVGSLLATTTPIASDLSFLSGGSSAFNFQGGLSTAAIEVAAGAQIAAHGGSLALIAPSVDTQAGSTISATGTTLLGAAQNFVIHFADGEDGPMDLIDFQVPVSALKDGSVSATPLSVKGAVNGGSVVLAAVSRPSVLNAIISLGGTITAGGAQAGANGDIVLTAAGAPTSVQVGGALNAAHAVSLQAPDGGALDVSGAITARDASGQGGAITLGGAGTATTTLETGGLLDASSTGAGQVGGQVIATGAALNVSGQVLAGGPAGGGAIALGGGAHGQDASVFDATTTTLAPTALVDASATNAGKGGQVTVWSNTDTTFQGSILARGGANGGDGGDAEVSGGYLAYQGLVDLRAPRGSNGSLLLDPVDVAITASTDSGDGSTATAGGTTTYTDVTQISVGTINTALTTANVTITADGAAAMGSTGTGKITFTDTAAGANTYTFDGTTKGTLLTFNAADGFTFASGKAITGANGLSLAFNSTDAFDLGGVTISTSGAAAGPAGNINVSGTTINLTGGTLKTQNTGLGIGDGSITLQGTGQVALNGTLNAGGGVVTLTGDSITQPGSTNLITAGYLAATATGTNGVALTNTGNAVGTLAAQSAGGIAFTDNVSLTVGTAGSLTGVTSSATTAAPITLISNGVLTVSAPVNSSAGGGTLSLTGTSAALGANITAGTGEVSLSSGTSGGIGQTAGVITAGLLNISAGAGSASGGVSLPDNNAFSHLSVSTTTTDNGGLLDTGDESSVTIKDAVSSLTINSASTTFGDISITNANTNGAINIGGAVTATAGTQGAANLGGTVNLTAGGAITEPAATPAALITATNLSFSSSNAAVSLNNANAVANLLAFGAKTGASFTDAQTLNVEGPNTTSGPLVLTTTTGDIGVSNNLTASGDLTFNAAGSLTTKAITVSGDYAVTAMSFPTGGELTPTLAATSNFSVTPTGTSNFDLAALGPTIMSGGTSSGTLSVTVGSGLIVDSSVSTLKFGGFALTGEGVTVNKLTANSAGATLTATSSGDGVAVDGALTATGQTVTLTTVNGAIMENGTGSIGAGTLNASAGTAAITLNGGSNAVDAVDNLQGAGVQLADAQASGLTLSVTGAPAGSAINAGTGALVVSNTGKITVGATTTLLGSGSPGVSLTSSNGAVEFLGAVNLASDMTVAASTTVAFDSTVDGPYALTSGTGTGVVTTFSGAVGGMHALASLTAGDATVDANVTTGGPITLGNLAVGANLVTLSAGGAVTTGAIDSSTGTARSLYVSAPGQVFTAKGNIGANHALAALGISAASTAGAGFGATASNDVQTLAATLSNGGLTFENGGNGLTVGTVNGLSGIDTSATNGAVVLSGGALTLNQAVNLGTGALTLAASGAITQADAGAITAATLNAKSTGTGTAPQIALTSTGNTVGTVANLQAKGASFTDADTSGLTLDVGGVTGAAISGGAGALSVSNSGPITVASGTSLAGAMGVSVTSTGGAVNFPAAYMLGGDTTVNANTTVNFAGAVDGAHAIDVTGGTTTFGGPVGGSTPLTSVTAGVTTLQGDIATTGLISLGALTLSSPAAQTFTLASSNGGISLATVDGLAAGAQSLFLSAPNGTVTASGTIGGGEALVNVGVTAHAVAAGGFSNTANDFATFAADVSTGALSVNDGANALTIGAVSGTVGGSPTTVTGLTLTNANASLSAGTLTLTDAVGIGTGALFLTATTNGAAITQTAAITAGTLSGSAAGPITLTNGGNAISGIGALSTSAAGDIGVVSDVALAVAGTVQTNAGTISLTGAGLSVSNPVAMQPAVSASAAVNLTATGGGALSISSPVTAGGAYAVTLVASGTTPGEISEAGGGLISAGSASFNGGLVTLGGANTINTLTSGVATTGATFVNAQALTVQGFSTTSGPLSLTTTTGNLTVSNPLTAPGSLMLTADGGVLMTDGESVTGDYTIKASSFTGAGTLSPTLSPTSGFSVEQTVGNLDIATLDPTYTAPPTTGGLTVIADTGAITDSAPGTLTTGYLTATGTTVTLPAVIAGGAVKATATAGALTLDGSISAATHTVTLKATGGAITQAAGSGITAATLSAVSDNAVTLDQANAVGEVTNLSGAGATFVDPGVTTLTLDMASGGAGALKVSARALTLAGTGTFGGAGVNFTSTGTGSAGGLTLAGTTTTLGALTLNAGGDLNQTAGSLSGGSIGATAGGAITLASTVVATNAASFAANGGALNQTAGTITAGSFTGSATGGISLPTLSTPTVSSLTNSVSGDIAATLTGLGTTALASASNTAGAITIADTGGALHLTGAVSATSGGAPAAVTLSSVGLLDQTSAGTINGSSLSASGAAGVDLSEAANTVATLTLLSDTTAADTAGVKFTDASSGSLTVVTANGAAGGVTLVNPNGLSLTGSLTAGASGGAQVASLSASSGAIAESGGTITAGHLSAAGASIALNGSNAVGQVDNLAATGAGGATFTDGVTSLKVLAANGGAGALSVSNTGALELAGAIQAGTAAGSQTITLTAGSLLSEDAGASIAGYALSASGGAGVTLTQSNAIGVLTKLADTSTGGVGASFTNTGSFTVDSATSTAGNISLTSTAGGLSLSGTGVSAAGHQVTLMATQGAISQDAGGAVTAAILTGQGGTGFTLGAASNAVNQLINASSMSGTLSLADTVALQVSGAIAAPTVQLSSTATLTQDLTSAINAGNLSASATGGLSLGGQNAVTTLAALNDSGAGGATFNNSGTGALSVLAANAGSSGDLTLTTAGSLAVSGALTAGIAGGGQSAILTAASVSETTGGSVTAGTLTGQATNGAFILGQSGNGVGKLAALTATGAITLVDSQGLEVTSAIGAGGALSLTSPSLTLDAAASLGGSSVSGTTTAGPISLAGDISSAGAVDLSATGGALSQTAGTITAGSFMGSAQGGVTLIALSTPVVTSLSNTNTGDINVVLTGGAATSGAVSNSAGAITIGDAGGALAFAGAVTGSGAIQLTSAGALSGVSVQSSGGAVALTGAGVDFTGGGSGVVSAATSVTVVAGAGNATFSTLSSTSGDVTVSGQTIGVANALNVGRDLVLTGTNFTGVALDPTFATGTGRDFLLTDTAGGLSFTGLHAPRNLVVVATDPAAGDSAPLVGTSLTADTGSISVTATSIALSGAVTATGGGVTMTAGAGPISLGGLVNAGAQAVSLTSAGAVGETGSGAIHAASLTVNAGGAIALGGANAVGSATLANSGSGGLDFVDTTSGATVQSAATVGGDIDISNTGGALTLASDLVAPGAISLSATGALTGGALTAQGGAINATSQGLALSGAVQAATGVTLNAGAGSASLQAVTAQGGDVNLSGGAITVGTVAAQGSATIVGSGAVAAQSLTASTGALAVTGGGVSFTDGSAATTANLTSSGAIGFDTLTSGGDATVSASGGLMATSLTATAGAAKVTAASITLSSLNAGGAATLDATAGDIALPTLVSGGDIALTATGAATLGSAVAGGALDAEIGGALSGQTLTATAGALTFKAASASLGVVSAGGALQATTTTGDLTATSLTAQGDASVNAGGMLQAMSLSAGGQLQATAGGSLSFSNASAGGSATLKAAAIQFGSLSAGQDATVTSGAGVTAASIAVGRNLALTAGGDVAAAALKGGAGGGLSLSGQDIVLGAASGAPTASDSLTTGSGTTVTLTAPGQVTVNVSGPATLTTISAGGNASLATAGGDLSVASLTVGGALNVDAGGGSATLGAVSVTGGPAVLDADLDVVLGAGSAPAAAGVVFNAPTAGFTVAAGRDALISYANTLSPTSVSAGRNVYLASSGGAVTLPTLTAGGGATVLGATGVSLNQATTGASLSATAGSGAASINTAKVGGDLTLVATAGDATLNAVDMTAALAGTRTLTLSASGNAVLGAASDGATPGALTLAAPAQTLVNVLSTGGGGGMARVDVTGDATLSQVASASGTVTVEATGAVNGAPASGVLFSAATTLNVTAGGAVTMGGQSTAGGKAAVISGGLLTLDALTGADVSLRADDLALTGLAKATQVCDPNCAAPTLSVESRTGLLTLGSTPSNSGFATGGMTIDSGELQRLQGDLVALYAGDTTNAAARGDLQVGSFTLNATAIKSLALYAGPANAVRVAGVVTPSTANTGVLTIGDANAADGWTPQAIYVSGGLGTGASNSPATADALQSVSLNSLQNTLIGGPLFQKVVTAAEPATGGGADINITSGVPVGVQPTLADLNRNLIVTGVLTLRSNGYIVQENTGVTGEQTGILITNPTHQAEVLTLGRVSPSATGQLTPDLIDLSLSFVSPTGGLISREVAATSLAIDIGDLDRSNFYRVNGCTIGVAGSCTPLPNTIVDIRIDKLVEGVQVATEDPPPTDDPTITGAGNEEIWRTPPCDPSGGRTCR